MNRKILMAVLAGWLIAAFLPPRAVTSMFVKKSA